MTGEEFKIIYQNHVKQIRNYIYYRSGDVDVADDITQETFIKFWRKSSNYKRDNIKSLLYKISSDLFLDFLRQKKYESEYIKEITFTVSNNSEAINKEEILEKCQIALRDLSDKERVVFLMNKKDSIAYKDIAESLDISVKAVEKRMSNALNKLKFS